MMRQCGDCTLCCRLVPVETLNKPANTKCHNQTRHGCAIYHQLPGLVPECRLWSCQWLVDPDARELRRPDRVHYVIDITPDFIGARDPGVESRDATNVPVMQVWVDPDHPDAWERDPALRRYIEHVAVTRRQATLVRIGNNRGIVIFAPSFMEDRAWHRVESLKAVEGAGGWQNPLDAIRRRHLAPDPGGGERPAIAFARALAMAGARPARMEAGCDAPPAPEGAYAPAKAPESAP